MVKEKKKTKTKIRQKTTEKKKQSKAKRRKERRSSASTDEDVQSGWRRVCVSGKAANKWKGLSHSTKTYIESVMEATTSGILSDVGNKHFEEVNDCLTELKERLSEQLNIVKAPSQKFPYSKVTSLMLEMPTSTIVNPCAAELFSSLNSDLRQQDVNSKQLDLEIERVEKNLEEKEAELARLQKSSGQDTSLMSYP